MRVHEAARVYGVTSQEIMDLLEKVGIPVKTASSNIPIDAYDHLESRFGKRLESRAEEGTDASEGNGPEAIIPLPLSEGEPEVKVVRIGEDDEEPEEPVEETPNSSAETEAETATTEETVEQEDKEPVVEDHDQQVRRIIRDKAKILLRTKIRKSQRPIAATKDAIRREIMRTKESRFEDFHRKRREEQDRLRKEREEAERKRQRAELEAKLEAERIAKEESERVASETLTQGIAEKQAEALSVQKAGETPSKKKPRHEKHEPVVRLVPEEEPEGAFKHEQQEPRKEVVAPTPLQIIRPRRPRPRVRANAAIRSQAKWAWKREKRQRTLAQKEESERQAERAARTLHINETTTVSDISKDLNMHPTELIKKLIEMGMMVTIQQRLDLDTIYIIADEFGYEVEESTVYEEGSLLGIDEEDKPEDLLPRPPVVTVMGHVDHGKTKLLDAIRRTDVVSGETGGITQHIGAYQVQLPNGRSITFLDTPGHEAFTAMRARGAMVTDIVILVVAANEGVMPQTVEAIHHARAADVPIIVAVNKIDLPNVDLERVKNELSAHNLLPEEWGGKTMYVPISALKGIGIQDLIESIVLESEMLELTANPNKPARGTIIESKLDRGRGPVATVLVQEGTLNLSDSFVTGVNSGRIRVLADDRSNLIDFAGPATPVEILGISGVPQAGDPFVVVPSEKDAKQISIKLQQVNRERELRRVQHVTLETLYAMGAEGAAKRLNLIVRGDVRGSVEALCEALEKIESDRVCVDIIHNGVGAIVESDVMLASASDAIIIGFNVRANPSAQDLARREHVEIRCYRLIYQAIEEIKAAMLGLLDKEYREEVMGRCRVDQVFRASKYGTVAGCYVTDGRIFGDHDARLLRDNVVVHEGRIDSLRRFKDDVQEVGTDLECGVGFRGFDDIKGGDIIECFKMVEVAATL